MKFNSMRFDNRYAYACGMHGSGENENENKKGGSGWMGGRDLLIWFIYCGECMEDGDGQELDQSRFLSRAEWS